MALICTGTFCCMTSPVFTGTIRLDICFALPSLHPAKETKNSDMTSNEMQFFEHSYFIVLPQPHFLLIYKCMLIYLTRYSYHLTSEHHIRLYYRAPIAFSILACAIL